MRSGFFSWGFRLCGILWMGWLPVAMAEFPSIRLEDTSWSEAQLHGLSRLAQKIFTVPEEEWKHAESEHFVYHYKQRWMAERAAAEAEAYYILIKKDLKIDEDRWEVKAQIFLFETGDAWKKFLEVAGVDRWSGGFYRQNELFLPPSPKTASHIGPVMPHELTHMVLHRFVRGVLPTWLGEGVAEQQARRHYYASITPPGQKFLQAPSTVSAENYIPLAILTVANDYPSDESKIRPFYAEALRLIQFLLEDHPSGRFLDFLQAIADGAKFESALNRVYPSYYDLDSFEKEFRKVAIMSTKPKS